MYLYCSIFLPVSHDWSSILMVLLKSPSKRRQGMVRWYYSPDAEVWVWWSVNHVYNLCFCISPPQSMVSHRRQSSNRWLHWSEDLWAGHCCCLLCFFKINLNVKVGVAFLLNIHDYTNIYSTKTSPTYNSFFFSKTNYPVTKKRYHLLCSQYLFESLSSCLLLIIPSLMGSRFVFSG